MCALACCWSLFTVDSTAIAQLPTIKTTKTLNSATCTAVWLSACVCVCVRERECECAQFLWVFVGDAALLLLRFTLNLIVCVCVLRSSAVAVLLSAVFCYCSFGWQHLGPISNAQRCHLTHLHWTKVQPYHSPQQSAAVSCYTVAALLVLLLLLLSLLFRTSGTRSRPARRQRRGSERTRGCSFSGAAS